MATNCDQVRDKLIAGVNAAFEQYGFNLGENTASPIAALVLTKELAKLVDAAAVSLCFHAGMDGDEFDPALAETVEGDFAFHCHRVFEERQSAGLPTHTQFARAHSSIGA